MMALQILAMVSLIAFFLFGDKKSQLFSMLYAFLLLLLSYLSFQFKFTESLEFEYQTILYFIVCLTLAAFLFDKISHSKIIKIFISSALVSAPLIYFFFQTISFFWGSAEDQNKNKNLLTSSALLAMVLFFKGVLIQESLSNFMFFALLISSIYHFYRMQESIIDKSNLIEFILKNIVDVIVIAKVLSQTQLNLGVYNTIFLVCLSFMLINKRNIIQISFSLFTAFLWLVSIFGLSDSIYYQEIVLMNLMMVFISIISKIFKIEKELYAIVLPLIILAFIYGLFKIQPEENSYLAYYVFLIYVIGSLKIGYRFNYPENLTNG
ncbi:MAG: hypothetical protein OHK0056_02090 [Bacteriovoracaceae bacterium]